MSDNAKHASERQRLPKPAVPEPHRSNADVGQQSSEESSPPARLAELVRSGRHGPPVLRQLDPSQQQRALLALQRTNGNAAVARMLAQRQPAPANPAAVYRAKLKEAVAKLAAFAFGVPTAASRHDSHFWKRDDDPTFGHMLVLKSGKKPSAAIKALFAHPDKWKFDCAYFVQVAQLYALLHARGADQFDRSFAGQPFRLRFHYSSGVKTKIIFRRENPTAPVKVLRPGGAWRPAGKTMDQILADAPIGSRVTWTNLSAPTTSVFRRENTIKLGGNTFAAHGFSEPTNEFTRAQIEKKLARIDNPTADDAYINANIFINVVETYKTP